MAGLLKNQILKHLSRFAKNLSSDQLQLSTFRGHCELHNLDLNEQVLTDLLELPSFLQLTRAVCNHVVVKIHWTKLKSVPISVSLDEVTIEIQTCTSTDRPGQAGPGQTSSGSGSTAAGSMPVGGGGKYGFTNRVIDGMTVTANSVSVYFTSPVFQASFQLSRLVLESRSPTWKKADLRFCQVKHSDRGEVLLFKHLEWQMVRIEAKALTSASDRKTKDHIPSFLETSTPLRLIISQAMCRITIKKKLADSSVMGSRVVLIMDDLLWVLTDVQLLAAIHFLRSLAQLMDDSKKDKATRQAHILADRVKSPQHPKGGNISQSNSPLDKIFNQCNVKEPSYHLFTKRIDLHLCDDAKDGRSRHPNLKDGGTFQIGLCNLCLDYYPYSVPAKGREHWKGYREPSSGRSIWTQQLLNEYYERFSRKSIYQFPQDSPRSSKVYSPGLPPGSPPANGRVMDLPDVNSLHNQQQQLLASSMVLRLSDFYIYQVTTSQTRKRKVRGKRKEQPETFLSSDKVSLLLPDDMKAIHLEFTQYYLPPDQAHSLPAPPGNMYAHLGPLKLEVHHQTILWLNAFFLNFKKCLEPLISKVAPTAPVNIRIEALMPQILVPNKKLEELEDTDDEGKNEEFKEPRHLQIHASRVIATNCRLSGVDHQAASTRSDLAECLQALTETGNLFSKYERMQRTKKAGGNDAPEETYPWTKEYCTPIPKRLVDHAAGHDVVKDILSDGNVTSECSNNVWSIHFDPLWADFLCEEENKKRRYPFIDAIPLTLWIMNTPPGEELQKGEADVYTLLQLESPIKIQFDHWQYLFLMSLLESGAELTLQLRQDTMVIAPDALKSTCISASFSSVEIYLILRKEMRQEANNESSLGNEEDSLCDSESPMQEERALPFTQLTSASVPGSPANPPFSSVTRDPGDGTGNYEDDGRDDNAGEVCSVRDKSPACSNCSRNCVLPKSCSDSIIDSSIQALTLDKQAEAIQKGYQTSSAAVKKGISSLVASIDSIMSNKSDQQQPQHHHHHHQNTGLNTLTPGVIEYHPDNVSVCDDDAASLRSDLSSDSDQFVQLGLDNFSSSFSTHEDSSAELYFHTSLSSGGVNNSTGVPPPTEIGVDIVSEVNENEDTAESLASTLLTASNSDKKLQILKVLTLKVNGIEMCQQAVGWKSALVLQAQDITTTEHSKITWNDFQNSFTSKPRGPKDEEEDVVVENGDTSTRICCQMQMHQTYIDSRNENADPSHVEIDKLVANTVLDVRLNDIELAISKAMLPLVVEMLEVESTYPKPLKGIVNIESFKLQLLNEDLRKGSVVCKSPNTNPIFHIPKCCLERSLDGTVTLLPLGTVFSNAGQITNERNEETQLLRETRRISSSSTNSVVLGTTPTATSVTCQTEETVERLQRNVEVTLLDLERLKRENTLLKARIDILMETSDEDDLRLELARAHQRIEQLETLSLTSTNSFSETR